MNLHVVSPFRRNTTVQRPQADADYEFVPADLAVDAGDQMAILHSLVEGSHLSHLVRSHWSAYPSLRNASWQLLKILGHQWRACASDATLFVGAVEAATATAVHVAQTDGGMARQVVAAYLATLTQKACIVADFATTGVRAGHRLTWQPFTPGLPQWAKDHDIQRIQVSRMHEASPAVRDGLRAVLLTQIAAPEEVGQAMRLFF